MHTRIDGSLAQQVSLGGIFDRLRLGLEMDPVIARE